MALSEEVEKQILASLLVALRANEVGDRSEALWIVESVRVFIDRNVPGPSPEHIGAIGRLAEAHDRIGDRDQAEAVFREMHWELEVWGQSWRESHGAPADPRFYGPMY